MSVGARPYSGHRLTWVYRHPIPEPPARGFEAVVKRGNAVEPYRVVARQALRTELAAQLVAQQTCIALHTQDPYHYWTTERTA